MKFITDPRIFSYVIMALYILNACRWAYARSWADVSYWVYSELEAHYIGTIKEAKRTLIKKGLLIFKCQDLIHNHKMHSTHYNIIKWAEEIGFRLKDNFILVAKNRIPTRAAEHGVQTQKHARIFHSNFLVLEKI